MTDQEKQLIEGLASRIHNAPAPEIDRDADSVIRNGIGSRPDALYILTQTVLVQEMALNQAKAQIEELNRKLQEKPAQERSSGSFLGTPAPSQAAAHPNQPSWWGGHSADQPPASPPPLPPQSSQPYYQQQPAQPPPQPAGGGMFSGFLRSAATTAAGVIAGEAAFSALSGIFGHHSGGGFMGGGGSGFLGGASGVSPGSETIVNNYYDSPAGQSGSEHSGAGSQFVDPGTDDTDTASAGSASDDSDSSDDTSDDTTADDDSSYDDSGSSDDSGSYDDGGGSFDV